MSNSLTDPLFMTQRERMTTDATKFNLRNYALKHHARILLNSPEIDEVGYDLNIERDYYYVPIHLKTKFIRSNTASWDIFSGFFSPSFSDLRDFDITVDGINIGAHGGGGGVILQEFGEDLLETGIPTITYFYSDIFYIAAISKGLYARSDFSPSQAIELLRAVQNTSSENRFRLPRRAFLPITSPAAVLDWRFHVGRPSNYMSAHLKNSCTEVSISNLAHEINQYVRVT